MLTTVRISVLLTVVLLALGTCHCMGAERPASSEILPSKTLAYVRITDVKELVEKLDETSVGRMMKEQQLKSLSKQLFAEAEVAFEPAAQRLGLTIAELLQIPQGEITVAAVTPPSGLPAVVLIMDIDGQEQRVEKIWTLLEESLQSEMARTTEDVNGTMITVLTQDDPRWTGLVHFQKESMQVVSSNLDVAKQILSAWNGDGEQGVLTENQDFADMMRRSSGPRGATPQIRWFADPISLVKVLSRGNLGAQAGLAMLPVVGADGILALGGSITFASQEYDSFVQAHVVMAEPRNGVLAMLAMRSGDATPEVWVPHDVASYQTMFWDIQKTQKEFTKLYDSFRGEDAFHRDVVEKSLNDLGIDIVGEVMDAWGGRVSLASWFPRPARLGNAAYLGGIMLKEDNKFEQALAKVVERAGDDLEEQAFAGITYYVTPPPGDQPDQPADDQDNRLTPPPIRISFGIVDDYLLIANRPAIFERGIITRRDSKSLENELDFKLMASKLRRQPGGRSPGWFIFERPDESIRMLHELATAESVRGKLASQAENNELLGTLHRALEENPLPPFSVLRKYFAPTGSIVISHEAGFRYTGFGLRRK
jgi:hypothetical protein